MTPTIPRGWSETTEPGEGLWFRFRRYPHDEWKPRLWTRALEPSCIYIRRTNPAAPDDPNDPWVEELAACPESGEVWRHRNGGEYLILAVGEEERTGEQVVMYRHRQNDGKWTLPLAEFCDGQFERIEAAQPEPSSPPMVPGMMRTSAGDDVALASVQTINARGAYDRNGDRLAGSEARAAYTAAFEFTEREIGRLRAEGARQADGDDLTAAYFLGSRDAKPTEPERLPASKPPEDGRDVIVIAPVGEVLGWYDSLNHHWAVYDEDGESIEIDPADVLGWRELPRAIVRDGRVVGVAR